MGDLIVVFRLELTKAEIEAQWREAIEYWQNGDQSVLLFLLRRKTISEIPEAARVFLADVIEGKIKRPRKRPPKPRHQPLSIVGPKLWLEYEIKRYYKFRHAIHAALAREGGRDERTQQTPKEKALEDVAERFGGTPDQASHIIHPRRGKKT
jgi:hypothetical protein